MRRSCLSFLLLDASKNRALTRTPRLLATKSHDFAPISSATEAMFHLSAETNMHVSFCAQFGVTLEELEAAPESPATMAYGAFLLDVGLQGTCSQNVPRIRYVA